MGNAESVQYLSDFQNKKVTHEFRAFFDFNKDGSLTQKDFGEAKEKICKMSGWKPGDPNYVHMEQLFQSIWEKLNKTANEDGDEEISEEEWCSMWDALHQNIVAEKAEAEKEGEEYEFEVPTWLDKYIEYKFSLLDRTRDGKIESDEYAYVMEDFSVRERDAKTAFNRMTEDGSIDVDLAYFRKLCIQYFLSDDPEEPGNFINGKLDFDDIEVKYTPMVEEKKVC